MALSRVNAMLINIHQRQIVGFPENIHLQYLDIKKNHQTDR